MGTQVGPLAVEDPLLDPQLLQPVRVRRQHLVDPAVVAVAQTGLPAGPGRVVEQLAQGGELDVGVQPGGVARAPRRVGGALRRLRCLREPVVADQVRVPRHGGQGVVRRAVVLVGRHQRQHLPHGAPGVGQEVDEGEGVLAQVTPREGGQVHQHPGASDAQRRSRAHGHFLFPGRRGRARAWCGVEGAPRSASLVPTTARAGAEVGTWGAQVPAFDVHLLDQSAKMHFMNESASTLAREVPSRVARREATAHRITVCAQRLALAHGLDGFTMDQLAEETQVSRRTCSTTSPARTTPSWGTPTSSTPTSWPPSSPAAPPVT